MEKINQDIQEIWNSISYHENKIDELRKQLDDKKQQLKHICINVYKCHDYRKEDDGDYHRRRYHYICNRCGNFSYSLNSLE
jgi:chromosome segregation ATPase